LPAAPIDAANINSRQSVGAFHPRAMQVTTYAAFAFNTIGRKY
jgi:hypothetical protein